MQTISLLDFKMISFALAKVIAGRKLHTITEND